MNLCCVSIIFNAVKPKLIHVVFKRFIPTGKNLHYKDQLVNSVGGKIIIAHTENMKPINTQ
jgi:hypothetical protein